MFSYPLTTGGFTVIQVWFFVQHLGLLAGIAALARAEVMAPGRSARWGIGLEEQVVVPMIDRHLTEAEWQEVGERGFQKFTPAQRWIAMGQLVEVATPEEAAMFFGELPPPVKVLWRLIGKRKYRRYITSVRGAQHG